VVLIVFPELGSAPPKARVLLPLVRSARHEQEGEDGLSPTGSLPVQRSPRAHENISQKTERRDLVLPAELPPRGSDLSPLLQSVLRTWTESSKGRRGPP